MKSENRRELNSEDRRKTILDMLMRDGKVKVNKLSKLFNISEVTIRNDLSELESRGMLQRVHGGAVSTSKAYYNMSFQERMETNREEKLRIAQAAASLIDKNDSVLFNSGTTTLYTARQLTENKNLIIVTNSISIASEIGHYDGINLILLGGNYNPQYQFTYGDDTLSALQKYNTDKLILAVDGVHPERGLTSFLHLEATIDQHMIQNATQVIVVADHTKLNRVSFSYIDKIESVDTLITDSKADKNILAQLKENGIDIITV